MNKILKALSIVQEKTIVTPFKRKVKVQRINPYNPLTYVTIVLIFALAVVCYGIVGIWERLDFKDLFKYQ